LQQRSVEYGARISLERSLQMAQYWTGFKIPSEFSDFSKWPGPTNNEIMAFSYATEGQNNLIDHIKLHWPGSAPVKEKLKILYFLTFPPLDDMKAQYKFNDNYLIIIYSLKRWLRLAQTIISRKN
jgi:hypothetical protein